ncbi:MAG: hypothetical protein IKB73_07395 [Ruminococcus sp.]|nr:hypothetical protein [Ruminococcus sp.]
MQNNNDNSVKFTDLMYLFVSKLWVMILVAVIVGGSVFAFKYVTYQPMYKSTGSIYILRQGNEKLDDADYNSDFSLALSVVSDCTKLLTSRTVLNEVIEKNSLPYTYGDLCTMITIENPVNTRYLEISVVSESAEEAKLVVDSICEIGKDQIVNLMGFNQVNIVDEGTLPKTPCNSKFSFTIVLYSLVAFILTYILFVLMYIFDDKISDPDTLEKNLGLSVLALIPNMEKSKNGDKGNVKYGETATQRRRYYAHNWKENK